MRYVICISAVVSCATLITFSAIMLMNKQCSREAILAIAITQPAAGASADESRGHVRRILDAHAGDLDLAVLYREVLRVEAGTSNYGVLVSAYETKLAIIDLIALPADSAAADALFSLLCDPSYEADTEIAFMISDRLINLKHVTVARSQLAVTRYPNNESGIKGIVRVIEGR
ncbi:MAG: hypothetical protein KF724_13665 [Phycisphaeraceae bacterium]|nr:hypothetical protein [Phycisphaeraceae bacterium]